ncbi:hypothetical protein [Aestuariirhabdus litorea]|uniref:Uncharacterized protein n=1 Tax=Aestuariirhabdus litorea TaxID=2528527 RepID=A0A3P3VN56_9GAMM|nr:hypothetical protein [Aestuariirhabdus litorea]RRJ83777.1 hypothetical protein D0544_01250 [Aestuariirhabdus litorea]RWW97000.1 hypothetical protein DZC74_01250 [Endozoicomonadaceae bacterium GTF-13]
MNEPDASRDKAFVRGLYRQLREQEPSPELDARILQAAREQARSARPATSLARWRRWQWPTSVAATVALGSLIYLYQTPNPIPGPMMDDAPSTEAFSPAKRVFQPEPAESAVPRALKAPAVVSETVGEQEGHGGTADMSEIAPASALSLPMNREAAPAAPAPSLSREGKVGEARVEALPATGTSLDAQAQAESPEQWLARIQRLLEAGEQEQARQAFARFRDHYPEYPVETELLKALIGN